MTGPWVHAISLPPGAVPAVAPSQEVAADDAVAWSRAVGTPFRLPVARPLQRSATEAADLVVPRPGEVVLLDQLVARTGQREVRSPRDALFLYYATRDGVARLAPLGEREPLIGHVRGLVTQVSSTAIEITITSAVVHGVGGTGAPVHGTLALGVTEPDGELRPAAIDATMAGHIVVGGGWASAETLSRARAVGVAGVVVGGLRARELLDFRSAHRRRHELGALSAGFGVLVLEGFGPAGMEPALFAWLRAHDGRTATLFGDGHRLAVYDASSPPTRTPVAVVGDRVFGIRRPALGVGGVLVQVAEDLRVLPSGITARTGQVRTDDGRLLEVALANLEAVRAS